MRNYLLALSLSLSFMACSPKPKVVKEEQSNVEQTSPSDTEEREVKVIRHSSPEPSKLDSIKKAKQQLKNKTQ